MERPLRENLSWRASLLLALGVVATVLMALLLSVTDTLQIRLPPPQPTEDVREIAVATTMPPTVALPTATPTNPPPTATPTSEKKPSATPVPVVPKCGVVPADWEAYTVQRGDTLFRLAMDSGATVSALMVANCLDSTRLFPGMELHLPQEPPPPQPICTGPPPEWERYTVQKGDTLFSLARKRDSNVYEVVTANCLVGTRINAGQLIYLPPSGAIPTATPTELSPADATPTASPTGTPPAPSTPRPSANSIVDVAARDGRFDTLVAALQASGLDDDLSGGDWTLFAPTDAAFASMGLDAHNIADQYSTSQLSSLLLYHMLDSSVTLAEAKTMLGDVTMANGQQAGLKFFEGSLYVNDNSRVIGPDMNASNGIIHVVDTVILGPWPR